MTLWRVEWLRIWRTCTVWVLFGIFIFIGVLGTLTAQFLPDIVERAGVAGEIALPPTSPELAMSQYVGNALQIGVLAIAFIAATALAFDSKPEIAVFYRARSTVVEILTPRYVVIAATAVAAFVSGTVIAFALSTVLIGSPDALATLKGSTLIALYIVLAVALVGMMSSLIPSVPSAALLTIGTLIILGVATLVPYVGPWLPSYLVGGFDALVAGGEFDYWRAMLTTVATTAAAVWASTYLIGRREI
jgi:ABC-2 type transport system permease protein